MADVVTKICDTCHLGSDSGRIVRRVVHPITGVEFDACDDHVNPCVYHDSFEVGYYRNSMPDTIELDFKLSLVREGVARIECGDLDAEITEEQARQLVALHKGNELQGIGPFVVGTVSISLNVGSDYDDIDADHLDPEMILAFLEHDWTEGGFEY